MEETMNYNEVPSPNDENNLESKLSIYLKIISSDMLFS